MKADDVLRVRDYLEHIELAIARIRRYIAAWQSRLGHCVPRWKRAPARTTDWAVWVVAALGGSAESWLQMQAAYDLWHAAKKQRAKVQPLKPAA